MATNKFKFKFKITGLELEVEGSKEDVAAITSNFGEQLKSLAQPKGVMNDFNVATVDSEATIIEENKSLPPKKRKTTKKIVSNSNSEKHEAIDFINNSTLYSAPLQKWTTLQKSLWTLFVIQKEKKLNELSTQQIEKTFNKHFKSAKTIRATNVSRDLGSKKLGSDALVGEDLSASPSKWFLTEKGIKTIEDLINQEKNQNGVS